MPPTSGIMLLKSGMLLSMLPMPDCLLICTRIWVFAS